MKGFLFFAKNAVEIPVKVMYVVLSCIQVYSR